MVLHRKTPIYAEIALEIQDKARKGVYGASRKLPSRKEICDKYNVSDMTALKVHNELERMGAAYKVRGSGVFFCEQQSKTSKKEPSRLNKLKKIAFFTYANVTPDQEEVSVKILGGAQRRAYELGLNLRTELFSSASNVVGSCRVTEDEGLIVPYHSECEWMLPLMNHKRIRCVLINNYFSEAYCVVNDNFSGIAQLLDYLESKGCRNIVLGTKHFNSLGIANLGDRTYAFEQECTRRGIAHRVVVSGDYNELVELLKSADAPDAVMFTSDNPAMKFKEILKDVKIRKRPFVTGFDGLFDSEKELTTIKVDYERMGSEAVNLMLKNTLEDWNMPDIVRVPCKLLAKTE